MLENKEEEELMAEVPRKRSRREEKVVAVISKNPDSGPKLEPEVASEVKSESKPESKPEPKPETKAVPKKRGRPKTKTAAEDVAKEKVKTPETAEEPKPKIETKAINYKWVLVGLALAAILFLYFQRRRYRQTLEQRGADFLRRAFEERPENPPKEPPQKRWKNWREEYGV